MRNKIDPFPLPVELGFPNKCVKPTSLSDYLRSHLEKYQISTGYHTERQLSVCCFAFKRRG